MIEIIPSLLTNDPKELEEKIRALESIAKRVEGSELCRRIQVDIVDGVFADNRTVSPDVVGRIETSLLVDFHLMTKEPMDWIERCVSGQAERIIGQVEQMSSQRDFVGRVVEMGTKVGLALDLDTTVEALDEAVLTDLDVVLLMSVKAGYGGQEFDSGAIEKVGKLKELRFSVNASFRICVDGGINESNIEQVVGVGADEVCIGQHLFAEDIAEHIERLRKAAYGN